MKALAKLLTREVSQLTIVTAIVVTMFICYVVVL